MIQRRLPLALAMSALLLSALPASAATSVPLATFRTVHDLRLDSDGAGGAVTGRLVTEFTGSACAGYTTRSRFRTETTSAEGTRQTTSINMNTVEWPDGRYRFDTEVYANDRLAEASTGEATRGPGGIVVSLEKPAEKQVRLDPATLFPVEQVRRVLDAATDGDRFLTFDIFDGSEQGETVYQTSTVIGPRSNAADDSGPEMKVIADAGFATMSHWPVTISYFKPGGEMTPLYTMSMVVYENGLTRDIRFDYGTFALSGTLTFLEQLEETPCPE